MYTYAFDIDGTICTNTDGEYQKAKPYMNRIHHINNLFEKGNNIKMFTARGSTTGIDWYEFTFNQLESWGLKFHELILGKPYADFFVDDKGYSDSSWLWDQDHNICPDTLKQCRNHFINTSNAFSYLSKDIHLLAKIDELATNVKQTIERGGKILFAGNGGSLADSQHLSAEFISKLNVDRVSLPSIALGLNSSSLTAIGNDYGYEFVFSREFDSLATKKDFLIAISTSGESENIINLLNKSSEKKVKSALLTGHKKDSRAAQIADFVINTPDSCNQTASIQEIHIAIGHYICEVGQSGFLNN